MPRRSTAIESARSALGWPGRTGTCVRWTVFCDRVRSEDILGVSQPSEGMFVTSVQTISHVNYKIFDRNQKPAFVDTVSSSYTENFSLLPAVARVQRSSEGAVRTNFDQFLQHLSTKPPAAYRHDGPWLVDELVP